jgi:hypothetical protein
MFHLVLTAPAQGKEPLLCIKIDDSQTFCFPQTNGQTANNMHECMALEWLVGWFCTEHTIVGA